MPERFLTVPTYGERRGTDTYLGGYPVYQDLPGRSRTILFDEMLDYFLEVWITGAKAPREPVSAALGNFFSTREHVELASLARRTDSFNV